jgi:hypothetical protein
MSLESRIATILATSYNTGEWIKDDTLKGGLILHAKAYPDYRVVLAVRTPNGASPFEARDVAKACPFPSHPPEKINKSGYRGYRIREKTKAELEAEQNALLEHQATQSVESERSNYETKLHFASREVSPRVALESDFVRRAMLEFGFCSIEDTWVGVSGGWTAPEALAKFRLDAARAPPELLDFVRDRSALQLYHFVF